MAYVSLFLTALVSATLFPLSSEALLASLLYHAYSPLVLWCVATTGNTAGSCINWYLGRECLRWQDKRWFPIKPASLARAQRHFQRYGVYSLLFAWLPVVGDPLTFIAGMMRLPFGLFFLLVALGKGLRYAVIIYLSLQLL